MTLYWPVDNLANLTGSRDERLRAYRHVRDVIQGNLEQYLGKPITVKLDLYGKFAHVYVTNRRMERITWPRKA